MIPNAQNLITQEPGEIYIVIPVTEGVDKNKDIAQLSSGAGTSLAGKMAGRSANFWLDIALAHLLGPSNFGLYGLAWTVVRIITSVSPLGLNTGVIRFGSHYWRRDDARLKGVLLQSLGSVMLLGLLIAAALYLVAPWMCERIFHKPELIPVMRWFALAVPIAPALQVASSATRISQRMKFSVLAEDVSQPAANLLLCIIFWMLGWRLVGIVVATVYSWALALVIALRYVRRLFPDATSPQVKPIFPGWDLMSFSFSAFMSGMFLGLVIWVDQLFVGHFLSSSEAGIFHGASQLSVGFAVIFGCVNPIFTPMCAYLHHRGEFERLKELYRVSTKWSLYLSLPPFLVMCFVPREIMTVLFGPLYAVGWSALVILAVGQMVNAATGPVGILLIMTGRQNAWCLISSLMFFVSLILNLTLIPRWGVAGAACATACSLTGLFILAVLFVKRDLGMQPYDRRYSKGLIATGLAASALLLVRILRITSPTLNLLLAIVLSVGVFVGTLLMLGLDPEDQNFIGMIRGRLRHGISIFA
jgi:O-antigen/teichoic acid export membrane protein